MSTPLAIKATPEELAARMPSRRTAAKAAPKASKLKKRGADPPVLALAIPGPSQSSPAPSAASSTPASLKRHRGKAAPDPATGADLYKVRLLFCRAFGEI